MFFLKKLRRDLQLEPQLLGRSLTEHVKHRIREELEGTCLGRHGYIIYILEVSEDDIEPGLVDLDTGALNITGYIWKHFKKISPVL